MAKTLNCKIVNFPESHDKLELSDCTCPICMYIMIEPVTMPCGHELCLSCFKMHVFATSLECPLCRKRIASWARKAARNNKLVNKLRWDNIQSSFPEKVQNRLNGIEDADDEDVITPTHLLVDAGEIGKEYQYEIKKLEQEREQQRKAEEEASAALIKQLQEREMELQLNDQKQQLDDEQLARQLMTSEKTPTTKKTTTTERTPTMIEKFINKSQSELTPSTFTTPRVNYTPTDSGKIISSEVVTQKEYPFVSDAFLKENKIDPKVVQGHGKKRGSMADFIYISDSPICITLDDTPTTSAGNTAASVFRKNPASSAIKSTPTTSSKMRDWLTKKKPPAASATVSRALSITPTDSNGDSNPRPATSQTTPETDRNSNPRPLISQTNATKGNASVAFKKGEGHKGNGDRVEGKMEVLGQHRQFIQKMKVKVELGPDVDEVISLKEEDEENEDSDPGRQSRDHSNDSIRPELNHFRPVRIFPRTPPKRLADGSLHRPPIVHTTPTYADGSERRAAAEGATKACLDFSRKAELAEKNGLSVGDIVAPAFSGSSLVRRRLEELRKERQEKVKSLSKGTSMRGSTGDGVDKKIFKISKNRGEVWCTNMASKRNRKKQIPKCLMKEESCSTSSMHDSTEDSNSRFASLPVTPAPRLTGTDTPLLPALPLEIELSFATGQTDNSCDDVIDGYDTALTSQYDDVIPLFTYGGANDVSLTSKSSRLTDVTTDDVIASCDDVTMTRSDAAKSADLLGNATSPTLNLSAFFESIKHQENSNASKTSVKSSRSRTNVATTTSTFDDETSLGIFNEFLRKAKMVGGGHHATTTEFSIPPDFRESSGSENVERWLAESCTSDSDVSVGSKVTSSRDVNENLTSQMTPSMEYSETNATYLKSTGAKRKPSQINCELVDDQSVSPAKKAKVVSSKPRRLSKLYKYTGQRRYSNIFSALSTLSSSRKPPPGPSARRTQSISALRKAKKRVSMAAAAAKKQRTQSESISTSKSRNELLGSRKSGNRKRSDDAQSRDAANGDSDLSECESITSRTRSRTPVKHQRRTKSAKNRRQNGHNSNYANLHPKCDVVQTRDHSSDNESIASRTRNHKTPSKNDTSRSDRKQGRGGVLSRDHQTSDVSDCESVASRTRSRTPIKSQRRVKVTPVKSHKSVKVTPVKGHDIKVTHVKGHNSVKGTLVKGHGIKSTPVKNSNKVKVTPSKGHKSGDTKVTPENNKKRTASIRTGNSELLEPSASPDRPKRARTLPKRFCQSEAENADDVSPVKQLPGKKCKTSNGTEKSTIKIRNNTDHSIGSETKRERKIPARYRNQSQSVDDSPTKPRSQTKKRSVVARKDSTGSDVFVTSDDVFVTSDEENDVIHASYNAMCRRKTAESTSTRKKTSSSATKQIAKENCKTANRSSTKRPHASQSASKAGKDVPNVAIASSSETKQPLRRSARKRDVSDVKENMSRDLEADVKAVTRRIFSDVSATSTSKSDKEATRKRKDDGSLVETRDKRDLKTTKAPLVNNNAKGDTCKKFDVSQDDIFISSAEEDMDQNIDDRKCPEIDRTLSEISDRKSKKSLRPSKANGSGKGKSSGAVQTKMCFTKNNRTLGLIRTDCDMEDFQSTSGAKTSSKSSMKSAKTASVSKPSLQKSSKTSRKPKQSMSSELNQNESNNSQRSSLLSQNSSQRLHIVTSSQTSNQSLSSHRTSSSKSSNSQVANRSSPFANCSSPFATRSSSPCSSGQSANSELHEPRLERDQFASDAEFNEYTELQDRLLAEQLQLDFDFEHRYQLNAIKRKGSQDEYQLRRGRRAKAVQ